MPFLEAYARVMGNNEYYETVIKLILMLDKNTMRAKRLEGQRWYEIDDIQDSRYCGGTCLRQMPGNSIN